MFRSCRVSLRDRYSPVSVRAVGLDEYSIFPTVADALVDRTSPGRAVTATEPSSTVGAPAAEARPGRWYGWLALIALASTIIPVMWILRSKHPYGFNDAWYFYYQARYIFTGVGWFVSPFIYIDRHVVVPGASHPPLWTMMLVFAYAIGLKTYLAQLLGACAVGAAAVFMTGLVAREVAGRRAGLIAAVVAALYPNYWINFGLGLGETILLLIIGGVLLAAIRFWRRPSTWGAVTLGLLCALAALTRAEQILLLVLVFVPLVLVVRGASPRRRLALIGVGLATALVVLAPWVGFNLARFEKPTYLSTDSGSTVASANCGPTYSGTWLGYEDVFCLSRVTPKTLDESVADAKLRHVGLAYARAHVTRVPVVVVARAAREARPLQAAPTAPPRAGDQRAALRSGLHRAAHVLRTVAPGHRRRRHPPPSPRHAGALRRDPGRSGRHLHAHLRRDALPGPVGRGRRGPGRGRARPSAAEPTANRGPGARVAAPIRPA